MEMFSQIWNDPAIGRYYVFDLLLLIPLAQIIRRAGFSPLWAVLAILPDIGWISCAVTNWQNATCKFSFPGPGIGLLFCAMFLALRKWPQAKKDV